LCLLGESRIHSIQRDEIEMPEIWAFLLISGWVSRPKQFWMKHYYLQYKACCLVRLDKQFLPRDASTERGYEIACRPSVCPSVRNV